MTHPASDDDAAGPTRATQTRGPLLEPVTSSEPSAPAVRPADTKWSVPALKAKARQAVDPLVDKMRHELAAGAEQEQRELRAEVAELRDLVLRTRAEHGAELAALQEELAASRRP